MAYQKKKPAMHAFRRFQKDRKGNAFQRVVLLHGRESYLVRWAASELQRTFVLPATEMFDLTRIDASETPGDGSGTVLQTLIAACETLPLMSQKHLVLVEHFDRANPDAEELQELAGYIPRIPETALLILTGDRFDRRKKWVKEAIKNGAEYDFEPLDTPDLRAFIQKRIRADGRPAEPDVADEMIRLSGYLDKDSDYTLENMIRDIGKVLAYSGAQIRKEDVRATISGNVEHGIFSFSDALGAGKKGEALARLRMLLEYGENEIQILGLICSQFEALLRLNEMKHAGLNSGQMQTQTGMHPYRIRMLLPLAGKYSAERLRAILKQAYEADREIKTGQLDKELALELLVAGV